MKNIVSKGSRLYELYQTHPEKGLIILESHTPQNVEKFNGTNEWLPELLAQLSVIDLNKQALQLLGRDASASGFDSMTLFDAQYREDSSRLKDILTQDVSSGELVFNKEDGTRFSLHAETIAIHEDGLFKGLYLFIEKLNEQKKLMLELQKRDELLSATSKVNHILLSDDSIDQGVYKALDIIGNATGVDRVYVFENYVDVSTGKYFCNQRIEWAKDSVEPQIDNEDLQDFPLSEFTPRWVETMLDGRAINGLVKQFPQGERDILEPQDIMSILVVPILIKDKFWGFVGFDNCSSEYKWSDTEVGVLTSLASNIGLAYERIRTKRELLESQQMFNQIANSIDEVFYVSDPDQNILFMNKAFEKMFGIPVDDVKQNPEVFSRNVHAEDHSMLDQQLAPGSDFSEIRYIDPDSGKKRFISKKRFPVYGNDGDIIRYTGVLNETTSEREAQQKLEEALEAEKELNELKNRFIAMISHEIRTPITTIVSSIDLLETYSERLNEEKKKRINGRMMGASHRIIELIEEVLLMSKADAGKMHAEYGDVDLKALIQSTVDSQKSANLKQHNLELTINLHDDIVYSDERLLSHILNNLLSNAGKYSPTESTVRLTVGETEAHMKMSVEDEGMGIDEKYLARIFEPFFRTREVFDIEGTGLGLPIVKGSAEAMGGIVEVTSKKGEGSTFTVTIPMKR
jgi:PAS domain S-box-containing protein